MVTAIIYRTKIKLYSFCFLNILTKNAAYEEETSNIRGNYPLNNNKNVHKYTSKMYFYLRDLRGNFYIETENLCPMENIILICNKLTQKEIIKVFVA